MKLPTTVRRCLTVAAAALVLAPALAACSSRAASEEILLYYQSGAGENKIFKECIEPGTDGSYPVDDEIFSLPATLRTWNIRREGGDTATPIETGTKPGTDGRPGPKVLTYATAEFYLNIDCSKGAESPIVQFWENLGRRPWGEKNLPVALDGEGNFQLDGWKAMLLNTLVPVEEKVLAEGTRFYLADDLEANTHGERGELERRMAPMFQNELRAKLGGDFFCGVGYADGAQVEWTELVQDGVDAQGAPKVREEKRKGTCPPVRISITDIEFADPGIAKARADVYRVEQESRAKVNAAQAELEASRILGQVAQNEAYMRYKAAEAALKLAEACRANSNCTVIAGTGAGVNVNAGK